MAIYNRIIELPLEQKYKTEIFGFGELYEIVSVEKKRRQLKKKHHSGLMILASNKEHSGQGPSLEDLKKKIRGKRLRIIEAGYLDSPPWKSKARKENNKREISGRAVRYLVQFLFKILVYFEFVWAGRKRSHMIYYFGKK